MENFINPALRGAGKRPDIFLILITAALLIVGSNAKYDTCIFYREQGSVHNSSKKIKNTVDINNIGDRPTVVGFSPTGKGSGTEQPLRIRFNKRVAKNKGFINIYNLSKERLFERISVKDPFVVVKGVEVIIRSPIPFDTDNEYFISIDEGAFVDSYGLPSMKVDEKSKWIFRTFDPFAPFKHYLRILGLSLIIVVFALAVNISTFESWAPMILLLSIVFLVAVLIFGEERNGAKRWLVFWGASFQPSEFSKFSFIFYMSALLARRNEEISKISKGFFPPWIILLLLTFLVFAQPDVGTAILYLAVGYALLFFSGASYKALIGSFSAIVVAAFFLLFRESYSHVLMRITGWLNSEANKTDLSFQLTQSIHSLKTGGFFGSSIAHLAEHRVTLPAANNDFIIAVIAQKSGFIGVLITITLFILFAFRGFLIARRTKNLFLQNMAFGIVFIISIQAIVNLFVVTGLFPTTGMTLPFISYGGTSTIITMIMTAVLINISMRTEE